MFKKLIIMALFAMACSVAYAAPPNSVIAYTTQTDSIATMQNEKVVQAVPVAYKRYTNLFEMTPAVMIMPVKHKTITPVTLANDNTAVARGGYIGIIRSI